MKKINLTTPEVAEFFEEYTLLRQAEQSHKQTLKIMSEHQKHKAMQQFLSSLLNAQNLIKGLLEFPHLISEYIIVLLAQAEKNDTELKALASIAAHLSDIKVINEKMPYKQKLRHSLFYPSVILVVCIALVLMLTIFVIPVYKELFYGFGSELPAFTQFFITVAGFLEKGLIIFIVLFVAASIYLQSPMSLAFRSKLILMLPSIGKLSCEIETISIIKALYLLLSHDFTLAEALRLSATATQNTVMKKALLNSAEAATKKQSFVEVLALDKIFSIRTLHILTVFDKTQCLDLLQNYTAQISNKITREGQTSLRSVSIVLLVFCWLVVGSTVIALYLPIFAMGSAVG
ncbi:MAG: hypothetical protein GQ569_08270 [Methylococcaceae bacterium]|nr:hypothetical protein [Methylococcaceae bacterium]